MHASLWATRAKGSLFWRSTWRVHTFSGSTGASPRSLRLAPSVRCRRTTTSPTRVRAAAMSPSSPTLLMRFVRHGHATDVLTEPLQGLCWTECSDICCMNNGFARMLDWTSCNMPLLLSTYLGNMLRLCAGLGSLQQLHFGRTLCHTPSSSYTSRLPRQSSYMRCIEMRMVILWQGCEARCVYVLISSKWKHR